MLKLEFIDVVRYEARRPKAKFFLADRERMFEKRIVVFGTGAEAYFVHQFLEQNGL